MAHGKLSTKTLANLIRDVKGDPIVQRKLKKLVPGIADPPVLHNLQPAPPIQQQPPAVIPHIMPAPFIQQPFIGPLHQLHEPLIQLPGIQGNDNWDLQNYPFNLAP